MADDVSARLVERVYLIRKQGYFYRADCKGYTSSPIEAGRYTLEEAEKYTHPNGTNGPRDGMDYLHENDVACPSWLKFKEVRDALEAAQAEIATLRERADALALQADEWEGKYAIVREQNARLIKRLEVVDGVSWESGDGIACRDETIRLQDQRINRFLAEIATLRAELAAAREALGVFGGDAAIEAKRLFDRMMTTPRHTPKRKELAARHYEASKRAAMVRRAMLAAAPMRGEVERKDKALRWIADRAAKLRGGTDDWFELVEFENFARAALSKGPTQ